MFQKVFIIVNPASTNFGKSQRWLTEFRELLPDVSIEILKTAPGGIVANSKYFYAKAAELGPHTLIGIAGGDGTINLVAEILQDPRMPETARQSVILPLWGGNANDLAWMLNGSIRGDSLRGILKRGKVVQVHPMLFRFEGALQAERLAVMSASFGATALVAKRINEASHRQNNLKKYAGIRQLHEGLIAWKTVTGASLHTVHEAGKIRQIYERTFVNGPRMAKYYHMPLRLTDDQFYVDTIVGKKRVVTPTALTFSLWRRARKDVFQKEMSFTVCDAVWAQFDGEILRIPAKTSITATLSTRPLSMLSTKITDS